MNKRSIAVGLILSGLIPLAVSLCPFGTLSHAVTLNDFEINADKNTVKIILHTDERTNYTTETNGKQFSILLYDTQLSADKSKTPHSSDVKRKWTGKASSVDGDKVRITLPNLSPNQYAISVIQKPGAPGSKTAAAPASQTAPEQVERPSRVAVKPRSAFDMNSDDALEAIVNRFQENKAQEDRDNRATGYQMPASTFVDSPAEGTVARGVTNRNSRNNRSKQARSQKKPTVHVTRAVPKHQETSVKKLAVKSVTAKKHISKATSVIKHPVQQEPESYNALTMAEPDSKSAPMTEFKYRDEPPVVSLSQNTATATHPEASAPTQERLSPAIPEKITEAPWPEEPDSQIPVDSGPMNFLSALLRKIPSWVLWGAGLMIVLGSLFVGFRIVRFLFSLMNANRPGQQQPVMPISSYSSAPDGFASETAPPFNTAPFSYDFQDTTRVNGTEYLMHSQEDIQEAVKNTLLLKFSSGGAKQKRKLQNTLLQRKTGTPF